MKKTLLILSFLCVTNSFAQTNSDKFTVSSDAVVIAEDFPEKPLVKEKHTDQYYYLQIVYKIDNKEEFRFVRNINVYSNENTDIHFYYKNSKLLIKNFITPRNNLKPDQFHLEFSYSKPNGTTTSFDRGQYTKVVNKITSKYTMRIEASPESVIAPKYALLHQEGYNIEITMVKMSPGQSI